MILTSKKSDYVPHPEGVHPAVCVDVLDLGVHTVEYRGRVRAVRKVRFVFESEQQTADGRRMTVARSFNATLHAKSRLSEFLGKWRGRPVVPGESVDLDKCIGASAVIVVSHEKSPDGETFASIDAVSKPTKRLMPSGGYSPEAARERLKEREKEARGSAAATAATGPAGTSGAAEPESTEEEVGF